MSGWWLALQDCLYSGQPVAINWITVSFWWDDGLDGRSDLQRHSTYYVVTEYWDVQGDSAPVPPGKQIPWDDFIVSMRRLHWDYEPKQTTSATRTIVVHSPHGPRWLTLMLSVPILPLAALYMFIKIIRKCYTRTAVGEAISLSRRL
ncbi:hypothetical protein CALCODRAFT_144205 [Calocera cornea HHB12733]|uniref:Uncharacterized protein n=1 Tax=Calocera cornea HHB12733 TaxID=1353952 RepID=A0A165CSM2_9BASI|nr:hypothetical protein CALCODRAFT_144205 [Calocera cornea HHB12733]